MCIILFTPQRMNQDDFSPFRRQAPDDVAGEMSVDNFERSSSSMMLYNRASSGRHVTRGRRTSSVGPVSSLIHWQDGEDGDTADVESISNFFDLGGGGGSGHGGGGRRKSIERPTFERRSMSFTVHPAAALGGGGSGAGGARRGSMILASQVQWILPGSGDTCVAVDSMLSCQSVQLIWELTFLREKIASFLFYRLLCTCLTIRRS